MKEPRRYNSGWAAAMIAVLTLLSKSVGSLRQFLLGSKFGAGGTLDVYLTAFRLPDIIYSLLVLGTLSVAFIPIFTEYYQKDKDEAMHITNSVMNISTIAMTTFCGILFIVAHPLVRLIAPGFNSVSFEQTVQLTRLMLLSPILFTISSVVAGYLTGLKKFFAIGIAPVVYNLGIIAGLYLFYPHFGLMGLGYGVIFGAVLQFLVQLAAAYWNGYSWSWSFDIFHKGVQKIGILLIPRILALDISLISLLIATVIGSKLAQGSITVFSFALDLQAVAISIFAISTAVAIFPVLADLHAQGSGDKFTVTLRESMIRVLFFMIPVTVGILLFRAHIVRLTYGHGHFTWENTILTFNILGVLAFAAISQSIIPLIARAFYAQHNTKAPFIIGLGAVAINIVVSVYSSHYYGVLGIALGYTTASIFNALALFIFMRITMVGYAENLESIFDVPLLEAVIKIIVCSLLMGLVSYSLLYAVGPYVNTRTFVGVLIQAAIAGGGGAIIYFIATAFLGLNESRSMISSVQLIFKRIYRA